MNDRTEAVGAIVVSYYPDKELPARIAILAGQFDHTWIIDNTPAEADRSLQTALADQDKVSVTLFGENKGIAAALNEGFRQAKNVGMACCATFDQDTLAHDNVLAGLMAIRNALGHDALIGANYYNAHKGHQQFHCRTETAADYLQRKTLITAGMLVPLTIFEATGGFREDYFIDSVDHEFCLHARRLGYQVVASCRPLMSQTIGNPLSAGHRWLNRIRAFNHSPTRKYYIGRNITKTILNYWKIEPAWCIKQCGSLLQHFISILLFESNKPKKLLALITGIKHALQGRMGKLPSTWPGEKP